MAVFTALHLSGSINGTPIPISGTSSGSAVVLHTATATAGVIDEIVFWVSNIGNVEATLTVEWGGASDSQLLVKGMRVPPNSPPIPIATRHRSSGGRIAKAFASIANVLNITGAVDRIS